MNPNNLDRKASEIVDSELYELLKDSIFKAMQMLTLKARPEHARIVFDGIVYMIRREFNHLTGVQLCQTFEQGAYGVWGDYSKLNPKTVLEWFRKKSFQIKEQKDRFEKAKLQVEESKNLFTSQGGYATLLEIYYHESGYNVEFGECLRLVETNSNCPFSGKPVMDIINTNRSANKLLIGHDINRLLK